MVKKSLLVLVLGVIFLLSFSNLVHSTILTFEGLGLPNYGEIPQAYGDNVVNISDGVGNYLEGNGFTSNIRLEYRTLSPGDGTTIEEHVEYWDLQYGDLADVAFPSVNGNLAEISFVADPGWLVRLNDFDIAGWPNQTQSEQTVRILDGAFNPLVDYSPVDITGIDHDSFSPNITGQILRIQFGPSWNTGIDNINFDQFEQPDQAIPEPSTLLLLSSGLIGFAALRKKFRK